MANTLYPAFALTTLWALLPRTPAAPAPWLASLTHSRLSLLVMLLRKSSSALKEGLGVCAQCCCDTHYTHCHLTSTCFAIALTCLPSCFGRTWWLSTVIYLLMNLQLGQGSARGACPAPHTAVWQGLLPRARESTSSGSESWQGCG